MSDRRPIYNENLERAILGCLAHSPELLDSSPLTEAHFFHFAHRTVFIAIHGLFVSGTKINFHSICTAIPADNMERMGGLTSLATLIEFVPPSAHRSIADELERCHKLRQLQEVSARLEAEIQSVTTLEGVEALFTDTMRDLSGIESNGSDENVLAPVCDAVCERLRRMERGEAITGFKTSLDFWNTAFGGIVNGQFYALAGRPGRGKTALMEQLVVDYLDQEAPVLIFEKDMSPQKLVERIACRAMRIPYWRFMRSLLSPVECVKLMAMTGEIKRANRLKLYNPVGLTPDKLGAIARREIRQSKVRCVFLDHVQALSVGRDIREGLTAASLALRRHVTETDVPLIALAHLNREAGDGRPSPNHIKEFDQLFGDVDSLAMLWYEPDQADKPIKQVKFLIGKNRDGGETEETVIFDGPLMTFKGRAAHGQ